MTKNKFNLQIAVSIMFYIISIIALLWGILEFFHEGWFSPYYQFFYYLAPGLFFLIIAIFSLKKSLFSITINILLVFFYMFLRIKAITRFHYPVTVSFFTVPFFMILPSILLIISIIKNKKNIKLNESNSKDIVLLDNRVYIFKVKLIKIFIAIFVLLFFIISIPFFINNITRVKLTDLNEKKVKVNNKVYVLAPAGPGFLFSNKEGIVFNGIKYSGLSWNEIALFGKTPIGFESKRYGIDYDGTYSSIYFASDEDFKQYNMFRYIDKSGKILTTEIQDYWRLPTIKEYVKLMFRRGKIVNGKFILLNKPPYFKTEYEAKPDKDAPLWACDKEVIYYWSASSFDNEKAFDIGYNGRVKAVYKTTKQDYRGFRAVKIK